MGALPAAGVVEIKPVAPQVGVSTAMVGCAPCAERQPATRSRRRRLLPRTSANRCGLWLALPPTRLTAFLASRAMARRLALFA